jgi:phage pi2 protein 07
MKLKNNILFYMKLNNNISINFVGWIRYPSIGKMMMDRFD